MEDLVQLSRIKKVTLAVIALLGHGGAMARRKIIECDQPVPVFEQDFTANASHVSGGSRNQDIHAKFLHGSTRIATRPAAAAKRLPACPHFVTRVTSEMSGRGWSVKIDSAKRGRRGKTQGTGGFCW
jgi:hypothetical protein